MAGRWIDFGQYGAAGVPGAQALARQLDELLTGVTSPVDSDRGLEARLRYLTASPAGYQAMDRAGIAVTQRTLLRWLSGESHPHHANLQRLDTAYWDLRRRNVARDLKRRLNAEGRGTRMEIYPVDQAGVATAHRRALPPRSLNVRLLWDDMVDAWLTADRTTLDDIWDDIISGLDSQYDAYSYVTAVGFG
ncbi:transcriptional regulator [Streptomyces polyrhachis]|uniref:Transcriptional regulator n=1 Tax=Streptomyces polyrhachis TaxID=1282885 RepID=A0ABW2GH84_9ACTN